MAEREEVFRIRFEDGGTDQVLQGIIASQNQIVEGYSDIEKAQEGAFDEANKGAKELDKTLKDNAKQLDTNKTKTKESREEAKKFGTEMLGAAKNINVFGFNLGEGVERLQKFRTLLLSARTATVTFTGALKGLRVAIAATGIGALLLALGSLVTLATKTQRGIDFINRALAGLSATVDVITDRFSSFGDTVVRLFTGKIGLNGAVQEFRENVKGIGEEIRREAEAAIELERRAQALRDATREIRVETAKQNAEIQKLRNIAQDASRATDERTRAARRAFELEDEIAQRRQQAAQENLEIIQQQNALGESLAEDLDREAEAKIELINIETERATRQRELIGLLNTLAAEEARKAQEAARRQGEIVEQLQDANATLGGSLEEVTLRFGRLREELQATKQEAEDLGLNLDFTPLDTILDAEEERARDRALGILEPLEQGLSEGAQLVSQSVATDFEQLGSDAIEALSESLERGARNELTPQVKQFIESQLFSIFGSIGQIVTQGFENALTLQGEVIAGIEEQTSTIEAELNEQRRLQEQGFANDVATLEESLAAQNEALRAAKQQETEIQRRAARTQLAFDSAQQASQLSLAVARLLASSANLGPFGIVAASIAGLSFIFSTIARANALAQQFSAAPGFYEGTEFVEGPGGVDNVPTWLTRGERVVDADSNRQLEGMSNEDLVKGGMLYNILFKDSSNLPIESIVSSMETREELIRQDQLSLNSLVDIIQSSNREEISRLIEYMKTIPSNRRLDVPIKSEYYEGNTKRIVIYNPQK